VTYILEGSATDLRPHINRQVEISGRFNAGSNDISGVASTGGTGGPARSSDANSGASISGQEPQSGRSDGRTTTPAAAAQPNAAGSAPRLHVESVRMLAPNCGESR
jgi:hypothetical protein